MSRVVPLLLALVVLTVPALADVPPGGWVSVRTVPPAEVWLDGKLIGMGTIFKYGVNVGPHRLEARLASGQRKAADVDVKLGETVKVTLNLEP